MARKPKAYTAPFQIRVQRAPYWEDNAGDPTGYEILDAEGMYVCRIGQLIDGSSTGKYENGKIRTIEQAGELAQMMVDAMNKATA